MSKNYIITDPAESWVTALSQNTIHLGPNKWRGDKVQKEKFQILTSDPNFLKKIKEIRKIFKIPDNGFSNDENVFVWAKSIYAKKDKIKSFKNGVKNLDPKRIGSRWYPVIEYYLIFNRTDAEHLFPKQIVWGIKFDDDGESHLELEIFKDTTLEDINGIWTEIKKQKKLLGSIKKMKILDDKYPKRLSKNKNIVHTWYEGSPIKLNTWTGKRFGTTKNFLEYKKAFDLKQEGKKYKEIAVELGWGGNYENVGTYIKRFEKAIEKNTLF